MSRKEISINLDRDNRNNHNKNYKELYDEYINAGLNASEALSKVSEMVGVAENALDVANTSNDKSDDTQQQLDNIVLDSGTSDAEVIQARGNEPLLKDRLNKTDQQLAKAVKNRVSIESHFSSVVDNDWTPALLAAHDSLPASGGEIIVPTQVTIKTPAILTKKVRLTGVGHTSISGDSTRATSVIIKDGNFDGITLTGGGSVVQGLQVDGAVGNGGDGIIIAGSRIALVDVTATRQGNDGIRIGSDAGANCNLWRMTNVLTLYNGRHGLYIHDGNTGKADTNAGYTMGIDARRNGGDGICVGNSSDNSFYAVAAQHNVGVGIRITSQSRGQYFYYPYSELNEAGNDREVLIEEGAVRNFVQGQRSVIAYNSIMNLGGSSNMVTYNNTGIAGTPYYFESPTSFKDVIVKNNDVSGNWSMTQGADRTLLFELKNTTTSNPISVEFKTVSSGPLTINIPRLRIGDAHTLTGWEHKSNTLNFSEVPPGGSVDRTMAVPGAILGDTVAASPSGAPYPGLMWSAFVSATDTVTVRVANFTTSSISTSNQVWRVDVFKHY